MQGKDLKPHIGIFGRRNTGKSSLINALVNQDISIVSDQPGTTTDPVKKSLEIFGIGPVILIDTAGIDDTGELGKKRISKSLDAIKTLDCAILVSDDNIFSHHEMKLIERFNEYAIPFIIVHNKCDRQALQTETAVKIKAATSAELMDFSTVLKTNTEDLINLLKKTIPETAYHKPELFKNLLREKDIVLLVTPIDSEAPEGRMILPQVMAIRNILDKHCIAVVLQETELEFFLKETGIRPKMVITDSQAFAMVSKLIPEDIPLTGFSILFAKIKGNFEAFLKGTSHISNLKNGDKVLIMENCSHRVSCDDIGRYKIPGWIKKHCGSALTFDFVSGLSMQPEQIGEYALVIQCGGCMATRTQVLNRLKPTIEAGIPVTNFGMAIAYMNGIFERATSVFESKII